MKDSEGDGAHPQLSAAQFWHYYRRYPYLLAKAALWGGVIVAIAWLLRNVQAVLFPVLVSLLTAYLLDPAVDRLEARFDEVDKLRDLGASRTLAIATFTLAGLVALVGFVLMLYPTLARQVTNLFSRLPELVTLVQDTLLPWIERMTGYPVPATISEAVAEYGGVVKEQLPEAAKRVSSMTTGLLSQTGAVVASLLNIVMIPVFTFYFLRDFDVLTGKLKQLVPLARREYYIERISLMDEVVGAWFRGQVTVALVLALLYSIGLGIVFGIAGIGVLSGVAIGVLAGLLNIIPYFGFLIGFVLSMLLVLLDWGGLGPVVGVGIVFAVVQGLEGWVITPKIVGDNIGLAPVMVIIVLLLGGELFGLIGVLLALPVAGIIRALLPEILEYYKQSPFYSGNYSADFARAAADAGVETPDVAEGDVYVAVEVVDPEVESDDAAAEDAEDGSDGEEVTDD